MALKMPNLLKMFFLINRNTILVSLVGETIVSIHLETQSVAIKMYLLLKELENGPIKFILHASNNSTSKKVVQGISFFLETFFIL